MLHALDVPAPLSWLSVLIAACAASAWALALGWRGRPALPHYRPVAALLTWEAATGLARGAIQFLLTRPARAALGAAPYPWPVVAAYHIDEALHVAGPVALAAAAVAVYARRRSWRLTLGAWAALSVGLALAYPEVRLDARARVHAWLETAAIAVVGAAAWYSIWRRGDRWRAEHLAIGVLTAAAVGVLAGVLWWDEPGAHWEIARRVQQPLYGLLLVGQVWYTARRK